MQMESTKRAAIPAVVLLLICLLWSLSSLRQDTSSSVVLHRLPMLQRETFQFVLLALTASVIGLFRRVEWPSGRFIWDSFLIGVGMFVAPAVLASFASGLVTDLTRVALFSLTPVFALVFEPYVGRGISLQNRGGLLASLVAVGGTRCLFPIEIPRSAEAGLGACGIVLAVVCVAAANCRAVRVASEVPGKSMAAIAALTGGFAAIGLAAISSLTEQTQWSWEAVAPELWWAAGVELPGLLLLFWLMRRMSAARMTTRFLIAPLIVNAVGLILFRPSVTVRAGVGLLLIAAGTGWLLATREEDVEGDELALKLN
jgi:drug/metabolite transporter (DMT)-like permease